MDSNANHSIKVNRAIAQSKIGNHPNSAAAMLRSIPSDIIAALPARLLAQLLDAQWALSGDSKAIATREAVQEGTIWDAAQNRSREIGA